MSEQTWRDAAGKAFGDTPVLATFDPDDDEGMVQIQVFCPACGVGVRCTWYDDDPDPDVEEHGCLVNLSRFSFEQFAAWMRKEVGP